jgi:hypothetical protein
LPARALQKPFFAADKPAKVIWGFVASCVREGSCRRAIATTATAVMNKRSAVCLADEIISSSSSLALLTALTQHRQATGSVLKDNTAADGAAASVKTERKKGKLDKNRSAFSVVPHTFHLILISCFFY